MERFQELAGSQVDLHDIHRAATALSKNPGLLRASLSRLSKDDRSLRVVADRSSVHPNGFAKIVLHVDDGWSIRLHVWPPRTRAGGEDNHPHGHRWVFASWIVTGVIREIIFAESPEGAPFDRCEYSRDADGEAYLRPNGSVTLTSVDEIAREAGTVYERSRSVLHTAEPAGDDLVASLVLQGRQSFASTPVYLVPGTPPVHEEQALTPEELRSLLVEVATAIR